MKYKSAICLLIVLLFAASAIALPPAGRRAREASRIGDTDQWIDVNKLLMFVTNEGSFAHQAANTLGKSDGLYFPFTTVEDIESGANDRTSIFAAGIWLGAIDSTFYIDYMRPDSTLVDTLLADTLDVIAEFSNEYYPGPMVAGTFLPEGATDQQYRVYKLYRDSLSGNPNQDYLDYVAFAVDSPSYAPWDTLTNEVPIIGDQWTWCVYNDADAASKTNHSAAPMGIEVKQEIFGFDRENPLGNVLFMRFRLYNKGIKELRQMYISLWADPDLGGAGDDYVGCDTTLGVGFCYNADNQDTDYGSRPPCVAFDFFQGPLVFSPGGNGIGWGFQTFPDSANLGMTSFNKYINGTDPQETRKAYWYMEGFDASGSAPQPLANGTKFFGAGDPSDKNDPDVDFAPDDRRWMQTTGPISFDPGDSVEIVAAVVIGQGADRLSSITAMKFIDQFAQEAFDSAFEVIQPPAPPQVTVNIDDQLVVLSWTDTSEVDTGDYSFEGYTVFQGPSASGPWTRLANYDLENDLTTILEVGLDPSSGLVLELPTKFGTDFGVLRRYATAEDAVGGGVLNNLTDYYFRVEAYSYSATEEETATSATVVKVTPNFPVVGDDIPYSYGDALPTVHTGSSGGSVTPEVVSVSDLTGHTYIVYFRDTLGIVVDTTVEVNPVDPTDTISITYDSLNQAWFLKDVTLDTVLLSWQTNLSGDDFSPMIDGFICRVVGPAGGFGGFEVVANANGPIDPPEGGALDFGGFPSDRPTSAQQVGGGLWGIHTADNGGTCDGGTRGGFDAFNSRVTRDGDNNPFIGVYDYEIRFTGSYDNPGVGGSWARASFIPTAYEYWVPFELWRTGVATPSDPSDDVRLLPLTINDGDSNYFDLESWGCLIDSVEEPPSSGTYVFRAGGDGEHSVSSLDNDPFTDWIYWYLPTDDSPGEAGYNAWAALMEVGDVAGADALIGDEVMARMVLVNWNGHTADGDTLTYPPVFTQDLPEEGTIFRILTDKPNTEADTFQFVATPPTSRASGSESELDRVRAVPNPYYARSNYDNSVFERRMRFSNLPANCTIKIFTLSGDMVDVIERENPDQSWEEWDVESSSGIPLASGIYIYVVEAPGFGTKIGKMAIFTEEEQLNNF